MSFISKMFEFILGSKFKKEAKKLVQSDEYQNAQKDFGAIYARSAPTTNTDFVPIEKPNQ
jgi:hypothetical protein